MDEQYKESNFKGSKSVLGMPVYSILEGQNLGQVKTILIDAKEKRLLALVIEKKRLTKEERLLPFEAVKSVGDDVITVERGQSLERRNADPAVMRALRRPVQPLGARCFTAGGKTMGKVEEYYFDTASGSISQLEISEGGPFKGRMLVDGEHIIALAPHTVMLADEAITTCRPVESNLLSSMEVAKDKAANLSRSTVSLLNNSFSKIKGGGKEEEAEESVAPMEETVIVEAEFTEIDEEVVVEEEEEKAAVAVKESILQVDVLMPEEEEPGQPLYAAPPGMMAVEEEEAAVNDER